MKQDSQHNLSIIRKIQLQKTKITTLFIVESLNDAVFAKWQALQGESLLLLTCLSLCNTQARAVNLIHAVLCDDEGVTQARGC